MTWESSSSNARQTETLDSWLFSLDRLLISQCAQHRERNIFPSACLRFLLWEMDKKDRVLRFIRKKIQVSFVQIEARLSLVIFLPKSTSFDFVMESIHTSSESFSFTVLNMWTVLENKSLKVQVLTCKGINSHIFRIILFHGLKYVNCSWKQIPKHVNDIPSLLLGSHLWIISTNPSKLIRRFF